MKANAAPGITYFLKLTHPDGRVERSEDHNLMPIEGLNHMLSATFKNASQQSAWYIALFENNYTPVDTLTAATFAATAGETTAYTPTARPQCVFGTVANGAVDNSASLAQFTFTETKTIYGGALLSSSVRGSTTGVLGSVVRFSSPKAVENGSMLEVIAVNSLISE